MRLIKHFIFLITIFLISCISPKNNLKRTGGYEEAIQNAILDFSRNKSLFHADSAFHIEFTTSTTPDSLIKANNDFFKNAYISVKIMGDNYKYSYLLADVNLGRNVLPTRVLIMEGRVFTWRDPNYSLTTEVLEVLKQYNFFEFHEGNEVRITDNPNLDNKKSAYYFFCSEDLTKFNKIVTTRLSSKDIEKLKCK